MHHKLFHSFGRNLGQFLYFGENLLRPQGPGTKASLRIGIFPPKLQSSPYF
jgi:hypothetical protein